MKTSLKILFIILLVTSLNNAFAQEKKLISGTSVAVGFPIGNMASAYDFGYGVYGVIDYNINKILVGRFDLGWNTFSGPDITDPITGLPIEVQQDIWEFTAGMRVKLAIFYIEGRGGYFTGVKSWGVVPAVGLRLGKFDIQGNINIAGDNHWGGARVGYYWGNN